MILNASAENGSSSDGVRCSCSSVLGFTPFTAGTSIGAGRYDSTASRSFCTPLFLNAVPPRTGTTLPARVPLRIARLIISEVVGFPSRYACKSSSSYSAIASSM